mgnify:CR=1 FL=1
MVTIVKHEWHQCDVQYALELDEDLYEDYYNYSQYSEFDEEGFNKDVSRILEKILDKLEDDVDEESFEENIKIIKSGNYLATPKLRTTALTKGDNQPIYVLQYMPCRNADVKLVVNEKIHFLLLF